MRANKENNDGNIYCPESFYAIRPMAVSHRKDSGGTRVYSNELSNKKLFICCLVSESLSVSICLLSCPINKTDFSFKMGNYFISFYSAWACLLACCEESACFHLVRSLFGITAAVLRGSSAEKCETPIRDFVLNLLSITVKETSFKGAVVQRRFEHVFHFCLTR